MLRHHQQHILIIEDNPHDQEEVSGILSYFGIHSDVVTSISSALTKLQQGRYAAVLVTTRLHDIADGLHTLHQVMDCPCIAMTSSDSTVDRYDALQAGFDASFSKPLNDTKFVRQLKRMI